MTLCRIMCKPFLIIGQDSRLFTSCTGLSLFFAGSIGPNKTRIISPKISRKFPPYQYTNAYHQKQNPIHLILGDGHFCFYTSSTFRGILRSS
jgi:hypothetical protein